MLRATPPVARAAQVRLIASLPDSREKVKREGTGMELAAEEIRVAFRPPQEGLSRGKVVAVGSSPSARRFVWGMMVLFPNEYAGDPFDEKGHVIPARVVTHFLRGGEWQNLRE